MEWQTCVWNTLSNNSIVHICIEKLLLGLLGSYAAKLPGRRIEYGRGEY